MKKDSGQYSVWVDRIPVFSFPVHLSLSQGSGFQSGSDGGQAGRGVEQRALSCVPFGASFANCAYGPWF